MGGDPKKLKQLRFERGEKKCTSCKLVKKLSSFTKNSQTNDGLKYHCKTCISIKNKIKLRRKNEEFNLEKMRLDLELLNYKEKPTNPRRKTLKEREEILERCEKYRNENRNMYK